MFLIFFGFQFSCHRVSDIFNPFLPSLKDDIGETKGVTNESLCGLVKNSCHFLATCYAKFYARESNILHIF